MRETARPTTHHRRLSPAGRSRPGPGASGGAAPFSGFFERDRTRQARARRRRAIVVTSIGVHLIAVLAVVAYSVWQVDELFAPSVAVKVIPAAKLPPGVTPMPRR